MSGTVRAHIVVKGLVQGVFYRATAQDTASALGLTGWAKNMASGDVEIVAEGNKESIEKLVSWCWEGPPVAKVDNISVEWDTPLGEFTSFEIKY